MKKNMEYMIKWAIFALGIIFSFNACSSTNVIRKDDLNDVKSYKDKSGVFTIIELLGSIANTKAMEGCSDVEGSVVLSQNGNEYVYPFVPDELFALPLFPGKYEIKQIDYLCESENDGEKENVGFSAKYSQPLYIKIPNQNFCKIEFTVIDSLYVRQSETYIQQKAVNIPIEVSSLPYCELSVEGMYYQSLPVDEKNENTNQIFKELKWQIGGTNENGRVIAEYDANSNVAKTNNAPANIDKAFALEGYFDEKKDISKCNVISFKYKGRGNDFFITASDFGETHSTMPIFLEDTDTWKRVEIPFDRLKVYSSSVPIGQFKKNIIGLTWKMDSYSSVDNELYVGDVDCGD